MCCILYYQRTCKKSRTLEEGIVRYGVGTSSDSEETIIDLTEPTTISASIFHTPSTITGLSHELSNSYRKNPLICSAHKNVPVKDSVIILPYSFATSTPKHS